MPMRATTVRFDGSLWELLEREAKLQGVSAAQFVRDATILRVAAQAARRGDPETTLTVAEVAAGALGAAAVPPAVLDAGRLGALEATGLLGVRDDPGIDRLTRLAARMLDAPVALVSLVDRDRQVFAGCVGLTEPWATRREAPLTHSFCQHAVASREPLVVPDAREHPVLRHNGAVRDLGVIAYAGVPLIDAADHALGTLCVFDRRPRSWTEDQLTILRDLGASVLSEIELRRTR